MFSTGRDVPSHCWKEVAGQKDFEESLERFTGNERLEATRVETEGAEYVGEGAENLAGGGDVFDEQRVKNHVGQSFVLEIVEL